LPLSETRQPQTLILPSPLHLAPVGGGTSRSRRHRRTSVSVLLHPFFSFFLHWTSSKNRLDRDFGGHSFGSNAYAQEELVAELAAAFLCADLELALQPREDHAAYIANWLSVLQNDSRAIFTAAAHAQKAADFIHKFSASPAERVEEPCAA
jgi:antirestriction protein ArdC